MAHETFEIADQSVMYFVEVSDNRSMPDSSLANPHESHYVLTGDPPKSEIVRFKEDEDNVETFIVPADVPTETAGFGSHYFNSEYNVVLPQEYLQEIVCDTTDLIDTEVVTCDAEVVTCDADVVTSEELSFDLNSNDRVAPHLLDHMYSMSCSKTLCICGACGIILPEESESAGEKKTSYKCCYCDYRASRRQHVKQHVATHLVEKPYKCKMCDYSASQKQSLVAHALRFHYKRKPFKCDLCDYSAFRKQHVVVHMGKHMKEKPFKCDDCDFQTSWKEYLSVHKRNLHPTSKTFKPWCE